MAYNKGDRMVGTHVDTGEQFHFSCPRDGMCDNMLAIYLVMRMNTPVGKYVFVRQQYKDNS